jgi:hypothetical protein
MLRFPLRDLPVRLEIAVDALPLDPRPVLAARPPFALLDTARRRAHARVQTAAAERLRQVAADKLHAVAVDALRAHQRVEARHREQVVHMPGGAVRVLPLLGRHRLHAEGVAAVGQTAVELGRLGPHHPQALGLAREVEEILLLLGVLVDGLVGEDAVDVVLAHAVGLVVERLAGALYPDAGAAAGYVQQGGGGGKKDDEDAAGGGGAHKWRHFLILVAICNESRMSIYLVNVI